MSRISQSFEFAVSQPSITWRNDVVIPTPTLRFPLDEVRFCPQIYLLNGFSAGLTLYWNTVPGAIFYVLQICDNQSFSGPNIRAIKTLNTEFELSYLEHLRVGDQFYWRVAAYNITGGASVMSEVRSVKIACPETQGVSFNNEASDYADISSPQMCNNTGVNIELGGPDWVRKTDSGRTWVLNVNYDCDSFEGHEVKIDDVVWEIKQSPSSPVTVDFDSDDHIKLDISAYDEEWFEIIAHVIFELVGVGRFECKANKKVLIEGIPVGGGDVGIVWFRILYFCYGFDGAGLDCSCYEAEVIRTTCVSSVRVGDIISIYDPDLCWFNIPANQLFGRKGTAILCDGSPSTDGCTLSGDILMGGCYWKVENLCCAEEQYATN